MSRAPRAVSGASHPHQKCHSFTGGTAKPLQTGWPKSHCPVSDTGSAAGATREVRGTRSRRPGSGRSRSSSGARPRPATCGPAGTWRGRAPRTSGPGRGRCRCSSTSGSRARGTTCARRARRRHAAAREGVLLDPGAPADRGRGRRGRRAAHPARPRRRACARADARGRGARARHARRGPRRRASSPRDRARRARDRRQRARPLARSRSTAARSSSCSPARRATAIVDRRVRDRDPRPGSGGRARRREGDPRRLDADARRPTPARSSRADLPAARQGLRADAPGGRRRRGRRRRRPRRLHPRAESPRRADALLDAPETVLRVAVFVGESTRPTPTSCSSTGARTATGPRRALRATASGSAPSSTCRGARTTRRTSSAPARPRAASCSPAASAPRTSRDAIGAVRPWAVDSARSTEREPGDQGPRRRPRVGGGGTGRGAMSRTFGDLRRPLRPRDADPGARRARPPAGRPRAPTRASAPRCTSCSRPTRAAPHRSHAPPASRPKSGST